MLCCDTPDHCIFLLQCHRNICSRKFATIICLRLHGLFTIICLRLMHVYWTHDAEVARRDVEVQLVHVLCPLLQTRSPEHAEVARAGP